MKSALMYLGLFILFYLASIFAIKNRKLEIRIPFSKDYTVIAKGIAISIIIYGHLGNYFNIRYLTPLGGIGVAMFLILSGYGINESWKKNSGDGFWKKRLINVFLPYIIIETVTIPIRGDYKSLIDVILDLSGLSSNYYLGWYIAYLWFWYLIYYVMMKIGKNKKIRYGVWIITSFLILIFCPMLEARQAFSFLMGVIFSEYSDLLEKIKKRYIVFGSLVGIMGVVLLAIKQTSYLRNSLNIVQNILDLMMSVCFALFFIMFIYCVSIILGKKKTDCIMMPVYYIGVISYELYLIHGYTLWTVDLTLANAVLFYVLTLGIAGTVHIFLDKLQKVVSKI